MKPGDRAVLTTAEHPARVVVVIVDPKSDMIPCCAAHRDCLVWPEVVVVEPFEFDGARCYWVCEREMEPQPSEEPTK